MDDFGWELPAGTYPGDPRAPWNQPEAVWCASTDCEHEVERDGDLCPDCEDEL